MGKIFFTSDTHFSHDKEFLYKARGFDSPQEMNEEIIKRWNSVVSKEDEVYHLGDIVLSNVEEGVECINKLNGIIHLIRGNHCTDQKVKIYAEKCPNIVSIDWFLPIKYKKQIIYLTHCPTITRTPDDSPNKQGILNFYGHTHQINNFYDNNPYMYHVGMDSHNLTPIEINDIIKEINDKKREILYKGEEDNV
jgi:calcineurin-like phosphoesterase family protein